MKLYKKRQRYKDRAIQIAVEQNLPIPSSWKDIWSLVEKYSEPEYVYFIGSYDLPTRVKIGKSINPFQRLKSLQTSFPFPLVMYGCWSVLMRELFMSNSNISEFKVNGLIIMMKLKSI